MSRLAPLWRWYRSRSTRAQWIIGGVVVFIVLAMIGGLTSNEESKPEQARATAAPSSIATVAAAVATATLSVQTTAQPTQAATPAPPTATPQPASPTPTPPPATPTPDPHELTVVNLTKSYRDNRSYMARASDDKLAIAIEGKLVKLQVTPSLLNETDALTVASQNAVVASKAFFDWYPDMDSLQVIVTNELTDQFGAKRDEAVAMLQINRPTASKFQYDGLKPRVQSDNKLMFCNADKYQIHPVVYTRISDRGCLTGPARL